MKKNHYISGFFAKKEDAENAQLAMVAKGFPIEQLSIFTTHDATSESKLQIKSNDALKDILVDGAVGACIGILIGVLVEIVFVATDLRLFIASPVLAPLTLLGWGASLGALVGTTIGFKVATNDKGGKFSEMIRDAISNGQVVLVAKTISQVEKRLAQNMMQDAVSNLKLVDNGFEAI